MVVMRDFSESFILGLIASLGGLLSLIFASMRKSRCGDISCCWGAFRCKREVMTDADLEAEEEEKKRRLYKDGP